MTRRILRHGVIVAVETAMLILLAATWGIPGKNRPAAAKGGPPARAASALEPTGGPRQPHFFLP